ncbi:hypothetical protein JRQ81_013941 [Phrynocephalus forsythii]|uniref:Uncharacterized protein n=1 Tax=Phrynocephalus forsythii TaxID=171643 RepID=A0A9Q0XWD0_9SAUR|nr:hypothetical protein JRQ81_013941 [Phrynocephalus forsythii]
MVRTPSQVTSAGEVDDVFYVDNRFGSVTDSGTATLKPRPRVRPLLTFLPLNAQETHGVAVPTPSVPEGFEDKLSPGFGSQIGGNYRKYNSVVDLRPKAFEEDYLDDEYIPPPPSVPPPPPPPPSSTDFSSPPSSMEIPPPPTLPPPPPPPPTMPASSPSSLAPPSDPYSNLSSPSTPSPPDFIPPTPPLAFVDGAGPTSPHIPPFSNGVSKWKSETVLNLREPGTIPHSPNLISPTTPTQKESQVSKSDQDPHLTFPRSLKIPPPTPVRTSSISSGEKDSSPKDEQLPTMVPHSRPALPPHFTIRSANAVHSGGEPERKATLEKPSIVVTESGSPHLPPESNGSPITQLKHEISSRGKTEPPSTEHASSNDDEDDEHSNLDKLKHELSALLISSLRKEDRTIVPKTKTNITDCNQIITDESKQAKPIVKSKKSPPPIMGEGKEKTDAKISSPSKVITKDVISTPDTMDVQANCVMKFKDELEAVLSPTKDGSPPLAFANLRHNPETKKQVTLQFGGGGQINGEESRLPEPIAYQNNSTSEGIKEDGKTSPSSSSNHISSDNTGKPPVSPQKPKKELLVPAAPSPSSSGTASPIQTASPNVDFSLLQYKTHRMQLGSVDSLASVTSSQTTEDESGTISNHENHQDSGGRKLSVTSSLSSNTDQTNNEVLIHPVTGEKVERAPQWLSSWLHSSGPKKAGLLLRPPDKTVTYLRSLH